MVHGATIVVQSLYSAGNWLAVQKYQIRQLLVSFRDVMNLKLSSPVRRP